MVFDMVRLMGFNGFIEKWKTHYLREFIWVYLGSMGMYYMVKYDVVWLHNVYIYIYIYIDI